MKSSELPAHVQRLVDQELAKRGHHRPSPAAPKIATGRIAQPAMNKIERDYHEHLHSRLRSGEILWHAFEAITLKLGHDLRYTIDEFVMVADGALQAHEVKGDYEREDSKIKRRAAAALFPWPLYLVTRNGDGWKLTQVKSS